METSGCRPLALHAQQVPRSVQNLLFRLSSDPRQATLIKRLLTAGGKVSGKDSE